MSPSARAPLAELLREQMLLLGLSQADVATQVGVRQQTVSKWLTGETQPRVKLLPALAVTLGLEPTDLSTALVPPVGDRPADETSELRITAFSRRIRELSPGQMDQLDAYLRGLKDGAAASKDNPHNG
ncbi:MAG TPA: helix-turn-helix transcriptional regulator [Iamia sp.]|nr:helix-turn-helix transcriptional regulator [Iamia sp.]